MKDPNSRIKKLSHQLIIPWLATALCCGQTDAAEPTMIAVDYPALVSKGDLDMPVQLGAGETKPSLPIGNGRIGTRIWTGEGGDQPALRMLINHADVYPFPVYTESTRDQHQMFANGCSGVAIDFGEGVFGETNTRNQLSLHDAVARVTGKGVSARLIAWHREDVVAVEITDGRDEPKPISLALTMLRDADNVTGPHHAKSILTVKDGDVELTQEFTEKTQRPLLKDFQAATATRARIIGRKAAAADDRLVAEAGKGSFVILIAVAQGRDVAVDQLAGEAKATLDQAAKAGFEELLDDNRKYWSDYWSRSFIYMSGSDELAEMTRFYLWGQYLAGCTMRGNIPPKHNEMIFAQQDQRIWTPPLWWYNESAQQGWQYEANRGELLEPVFRWNWSNREAYANAAQRSWNSRGWYVPETSSFDGPEPLPEGQTKPEGRRAQYLLSSIGGEFTARNTYNMAKFAALYYKKYQFTGDEQWLKEKVYPAARAVAEFYCGLKAGCQAAGGVDKGPEGTVILKKEDDGKYHLYGTMLHEHIWWGKNIIEDLAAIRGIFPLAIKLSEKYGVDADKRAEWQEVLDNLAPYVMSDDPGAIGSLGPGTWAQGLPPHGNIRDNMGEESPRLGPISGDFLDVLTTESDKPDEWQVAMTTLDKHTGTHAERYVACGSYPVAVARAGRVDLVERSLPLQMRSSATQSAPGISHSMQGPGIFARAIHAALLNSVSPSPTAPSNIHVLHAWPRKWDVDFQLQAKGGFLVSASLKDGQLRFVEIESRLGGECRIRNPWPDSEVVVLADGREQGTTGEALIKFPTEKGKRYVLVAAGAANPAELKTSVPTPAN
jgi:hypothetical protein